MTLLRTLNFILLLFFTTILSGQTPESEVTRYETISITENGTTLSIPFAGGLNRPLYSEADLNNDGIKDLFIYDRADNSGNYILRNGPDDYTSGFEAQRHLPDLHGFALMYDYNCDGVVDLFTGSFFLGGISDGITVYTGNFNSADELEFTLASSELTYDNNQELFSLADNVSSFVDIDADGDLDILSFKTVAGKQVGFYKNKSMELYGHCDSLTFELITDCHGSFSDDGTVPLTLDTDCSKLDGESVEWRHGVSSLLSFDNNNDGLYELMIGNEFYNTVTVLFNDGTPDEAHFFDQDNTFQTINNNTVPDSMVIQSLPTPSAVDVNMDGVDEILISNRSSATTQNYACTKVYQRDDLGNFALTNDTFLVKNMIDVGEQGTPVFLDFDQDGLTDLLIGNSGYFNPNFGLAGTITAYKNIGDAENPSFQLFDRNLFNIEIYDWNFIAPCFGDLDADGDLDMIIGEGSGKIHYFENTAGPNNPMEFDIAIPGYQDIDIGKNATPQIVDLNQDGLLDLVIGTKPGFLVYYPNNGTTTNPVFDEQILQIGNVDTRVIGSTVGYSAPVFSDFETPGQYLLYTGSESGLITRYDDIENNLTPGDSFSKIDSAFAAIRIGTRSRIDVADLDNDDVLEMVVSNERGGIGIYKFGSSVPITTPAIVGRDFELFPNPATNQFTLKGNFDNFENIMLYTIDGKEWPATYSVRNNMIVVENIQKHASGLFFIKIHIDNKIVTKKVLLTN